MGHYAEGLDQVEIVKQENNCFLIELSDIESALFAELVPPLLHLLESEDLKGDMPRLFPTAILDEPEQENEYQQITQSELKKSHSKSLEAVQLISSKNEISIDELMAVMKGLNLVRLKLSEDLNIADDSFDPPNMDDDTYQAWIIFQYLGQMVYQCVSELEKDF